MVAGSVIADGSSVGTSGEAVRVGNSVGGAASAVWVAATENVSMA
jgi:hypothetical protein